MWYVPSLFFNSPKDVPWMEFSCSVIRSVSGISFIENLNFYIVSQARCWVGSFTLPPSINPGPIIVSFWIRACFDHLLSLNWSCPCLSSYLNLFLATTDSCFIRSILNGNSSSPDPSHKGFFSEEEDPADASLTEPVQLSPGMASAGLGWGLMDHQAFNVPLFIAFVCGSLWDLR